MENPVDHSLDQVSERLYRIYTDTDRELLLSMHAVIAPHAESLAGIFYDSLLQIEDTHQFLNHKVVSERLHNSMTRWIESLFLPDDTRSVVEHIRWQRTVGHVHARIDIPLRYVNYGVRLLKQEMVRLITGADLEDRERYIGVVLVNDLLDFASALINESFVVQRIDSEQDSQALRLHMLSFSAVLEIERLRASLFDWLRRALTDVYRKAPHDPPAVTSAYHTEFGLWLVYKAELVFSENPEFVGKLKEQLAHIQEQIDRINGLSGQTTREELSLAVESLSEAISTTAWLLGDLSSQTYEIETGKDSLTRLFNRRFLPTVLQRIMRATRAANSTFCVVTCDVDDFKGINDQYGHDTGDKALVAVGDFLVSQVRATDYVFRKGGDEFLIILTGLNSEQGAAMAKRILAQLQRSPIRVNQATALPIGLSLGVVEYDGHPDYQRILKDADDALYQAKKMGKNTFYLRQ